MCLPISSTHTVDKLSSHQQRFRFKVKSSAIGAFVLFALSPSKAKRRKAFLSVHSQIEMIPVQMCSCSFLSFVYINSLLGMETGIWLTTHHVFYWMECPFFIL